MIIKNKKKFLRLVLTAIGFIFFINLIIPDKSLSHQQLSYKKVYVLSGETLWSIAKEEQTDNAYYYEKDIRDIMQDIKRINNLKSSSLKANQLLEIPTY